MSKYQAPLKLKNYKHNKSLSIKQFIRLFLSELTDTCTTLTEDGEFHCGKGKDRTIRDTVGLCKYYYPETDYDMVRDILWSFGKNTYSNQENNNDDALVGHYCSDVEDWIISLDSIRTEYRSHHGWNSLDGGYNKDSFGNTIQYKTKEHGIIGLLKHNYSLNLSYKDFI